MAVELRRLTERRTISDVLDDVEAQHGGRVGLATAANDLPVTARWPSDGAASWVTVDGWLATATGPRCPIRILCATRVQT